MHIVMISDWETRGGAAIAASRLAHGLIAAGAQVTRLVAYCDGAPHPWRTERLAAPGFPVRRFLRRGLPLRSRAAFDRTAGDAATAALARALARLRPDVIHLHNLHGGAGAGWSPAFVRTAAAYAPVAWTLHDMWPFTGRCVYNQGCLRFQTSCDAACPTAQRYPALPPELVGPAFAARRMALAAAPRTVAIAPSEWMAAQARSGLWRTHEVAHIPNGVDLDTYVPQDRSVARRTLGLPAEGLYLLAAMPHLADERKGAAALRTLAAVTLPGAPPFTLLTMGAGAPPPSAAPLRHLGYLPGEAQRALAYAAADLLVHLAPEDNLPNTVVEALACGTPCFALPVGGLPELVRPGVTGWLAAEPTPAALIAALPDVLAALGAGRTLREACRTSAAQRYDVRTIAQRHLALYHRMR